MSGAATAVALDTGRARGRLASWQVEKQTLTEAIIKDAGVTLSRCRDAVRNTPWGAKAARAYAAAVVGYGIRPSPPEAASKRQRTKIIEAWDDFAIECDADGRTDIYGQQALAAREMFVAGEIFFRRRWRRPEDDLTVPFQLQALRAEMLPIWLSGESDVGAPGTPAGNTIYAGIEFDPIGRRVAYHFHRADPGDAAYRRFGRAFITSGDLVRVPADDVVHIFEATEPGQVRGLPPMAAGLIRLWETDRYMDAQLARQHAAALISLIVRPGFDGSTVFSRAAEEAAAAQTQLGEDGVFPGQIGRTVEDMALEPNTILTLRPGEEAMAMPLPEVGADFDAFIFRAACDVAVAFGIPYSLLTGDLRETSFANERSAVQAFKREIQQIQFSTLVFQMCRPVWRWFLDGAVTFGALSLPTYAAKRKAFQRIEWIPAEWEWVDPLKDMQAKLLAVEAKIIPRSYVQQAMGYDPEQTDEEIKRSDARREEMVDAVPVAAPAGPQPDQEDDDGGEGQDSDDQEDR